LPDFRTRIINRIMRRFAFSPLTSGSKIDSSIFGSPFIFTPRFLRLAARPGRLL
jgi:hypothetical protein